MAASRNLPPHQESKEQVPLLQPSIMLKGNTQQNSRYAVTVTVNLFYTRSLRLRSWEYREVLP